MASCARGRNGEAIFQIQLDIKSPITGMGEVKVTFLPGMPNEISLVFACLSSSSNLGIQNGVTIGEFVLNAVADEMRKGSKPE